MHLHAAFVPPAEERRALVDLVLAQEPGPPSPEPAASRGLFRRSTPAAPVTAPSGPLLDVADTDSVLLPITDFGYLASGDARRLADALVEVCAALPPGPTVRVHGGSALVDPDDRSVWAELTGSDDDLEAMRRIASSVVSGVERLGFFRDRRRFKHRLAVATINDATTAEHLERVLAALDAHESEPWSVDEVAILQRGSGVWRTVPVGD